MNDTHTTTQHPSAHQKKRRSIRLQGYDYSQAGAYFITICTNNKECLLGDIINGEFQISQLGRIVQQCWEDIPLHFPHIELDAFVIMPNHIHGIAVIINSSDPKTERYSQPTSGTIPTMVRSFKSAATKSINLLRQTPGNKLWQRNYWEHVVRNESQMTWIQEYIINNPTQWELDKLYMP